MANGIFQLAFNTKGSEGDETIKKYQYFGTDPVKYWYQKNTCLCPLPLKQPIEKVLGKNNSRGD